MTLSDLPRVLIVEDNELVTSAMQILFESAGWQVAVANSIAAALHHGKESPAELVLLDLSLPDGDGLLLVEPLKAFGAGTVAALTGRDDPETRRRCLEAGCAEVLVKPVPVKDLLAKAAEWRG